MNSFIDLFSGAGGLSLGLEAAGFHCVTAVEMNRDACETFAMRHRDALIHDVPIQQVDFAKYAGIPLLAGGPPCQPFSAGGKGLASEDARDMIPQFVRAVKEASPEVFLMENVPGLAGPTHRTYLNHSLAKLSKLGYQLTVEVLNAAEYGVPQKRRRLVVVGVRDGRAAFTMPDPTHGPRGRETFVSAGSALAAVKDSTHVNESKVMFAKRPDLRPSPYDGHLFNGGGRAIDLNSPSHTILASAGGNKTHFLDLEDEVPAYHEYLVGGGAPKVGSLRGGRRLSVEESAALQTFPKGMKFVGSRSSQYTQIGNAVPPGLASALGKALLAHLKN
jgi:DNA (cytosine-5)-methyltransferase 1